MTTTTVPAPRRISNISYLLADLATIVFGPDHKGADELWFSELRKAAPASRAAVPGPDATATAIIPPVRPALALTSVAYELVDDEHLGVLPIGPLVPAYIHDALAGATR